MSGIKTREFAGFQIEDSESFVMTLNSKSGPVDLNCQEVMATAISKNAVFGNGQADNDIVQITGNSYNIISQLRSSEKWILAKASFESLNPNLTDTQKSKIKPKGSNGNSGNGNSEDKIKFTATHAQNLGKAIFAGISTEHKKYLANFDLNHSSFGEDTNKRNLIDSAINAFNYSIMNSIAYAEMQKRVAEQKRAEQEQAEKEQKLRNKAIGMLKVMGITEDDAEYEDKVNGILLFLSEDSE